MTADAQPLPGESSGRHRAARLHPLGIEIHHLIARGLPLDADPPHARRCGMSAQTYTSPIALDRMRAGFCPECGAPPLGHGSDVRFWIPGNQRCNLLERGVTERIEWQQELDAETTS